MRSYFDTSVLVSALVQGERAHIQCLQCLTSDRVRLTSTHSIAEVYATLTSGRLPVRFTPSQAVEALRIEVAEKFELIPVNSDDYISVAMKCARVGARGGAFFDVLHLHAARLGGAEEILTLNDRHFRAFAGEAVTQIRNPAAFSR